MANDKAIEYNSKIYEIKKLLTRMQKIGLNTKKYEELLQKIEEGLASSIKENNEKFFSDLMSLDLLNMAYTKAISNLSLLLKDMTKYEIYLKTASFCGTLRNFLAGENKDVKELENLKNRLLELLEGIKSSETLDYDIEGPLVEDIYNLAYEFIKVEISENGTSAVLEVVSSNEIDRNNIERAIINELEHLDLQDKKYQLLVNKRYEIDSLGLDSTYVREDFIKLILNSTTALETKQKRLKELTNKFNEYYTRALELTKNIDKMKNDFENFQITTKRDIKERFMEIIKDMLITLTSLGIVVGLGVGVVKLAKKMGTSEVTKTITTTYSSDAEPIVEEDYVKTSEIVSGKFLYEYSPYYEIIDKYYNYQRKVTCYDVTSKKELSIEEYLTLNAEELGLTGTVKNEGKDVLSLEDTYKEAYRILKEVIVNENDSHEEFSKGRAVSSGIFFAVVAIIVDIFLEINLLSEIDISLGFISFVIRIIDIKDEIIRINNSNKDLKTKEKELKALLDDLRKLFNDNKEIVAKIEDYIGYEKPEEQTAINKKLTRVREINSSYLN